jgi:alkylation response protein AidB-like acyl-CoA dehydrogenase
VNLDYDAVQLQLADAVAALAARHDDPGPRLADLGLYRLDLPLEADGLGLGLAASVVAGLELGRALQPLPGYRETVYAAHLLHAAGGPQDVVTEAGDGHHLISTGDQDPDVPWKSTLTIGDALIFNGTTLPLPEDTRRHREGALLRQAAFLLGIADAALTMARDHTRTRRQFGKPLIEFQTVAHRLAVATAEGEGLVLLLHEAAWRHDNGDEGPYAVQAAAAAADQALATTRLNVQLHGARGIVTEDLPAEAYTLAAKESTRMGTPRQLWHEAGRARLRTTTAARTAE